METSNVFVVCMVKESLWIFSSEQVCWLMVKTVVSLVVSLMGMVMSKETMAVTWAHVL